MSDYVLSPAAQGDIEEIWDYTVERWGVVQAERYLRALRDAFSELAAGTRPSRDAGSIRQGYRKALVASHIVFFRRIEPDRIAIIRILHQRMDAAGRL